MQRTSILSISLFLGLSFCKAQSFTLPEQAAFFPLPGSAAPKAKDISAGMKGEITPDSIIFQVLVTDDKVFSDPDPLKSDRVEVWFGLPDVDFSDYLVADRGAEHWIFRNSTESGDNADLQRFLNNADYPQGKLVHPETGEAVESRVPAGALLKREHVFYGITRFAFFTDNRPALQLDREKYQRVEQQLGYPLDDLAPFVNYTCRTTAGGYQMRIALHNRCLGFALSPSMRTIRYALDVNDADKPNEQTLVISSAKNRYYARPYYFNEAKLPFSLNIPLKTVPDAYMKQMGMQLQVVYSENDWKPYFFSNGPIIYGPDVMSDAGLSEYQFYPARLIYRESGTNSEAAFRRLDILYDDVGAFDQKEVYLVVGDSVILSSKLYRFNEDVKDDEFINSVFRLADGSAAAVLYDFEPIDPLGWGPLGHTADEFVYIQKLNRKGGRPIFNVGQRIEATGKVTVGDPKILGLENVEKVHYRWIERGKTFGMRVEFKPASSMALPDPPAVYTFEIGADNVVRLKQ